MLKDKYRHPIFYKQLKAIGRAVYSKKRRIMVLAKKSDEPIDFFDLKPHDFSVIKPNEGWGRRFSCMWLRLAGQAQSYQNPIVMIDIGKFAGEGLVFHPNGEIHSAFSNVWTPVDVRPCGGSFKEIPLVEGQKSFDFYVDCGFNGFLMLDVLKAKFRNAFVAEKNQQIYSLYYDFLTLFLLFSSSNDAAQKSEISAALKQAFSHFRSKNIDQARQTLAEILKKPSTDSLEFSAIGHGHLDLAWMWPIRETKRKAARTLTNALCNIAAYPDYIFGTSQPQQWEWIRQNHPQLFEKFQKAVAAGKIEIQGGFWAECDTNLPSGESLIRQAVYGIRYAKQYFNVTPKMCWLPDAFGYNGNLPQILKKCGMQYFSTIKLSWNKVTKFPYRTFYWEGIDNSKVLVHMPPEGDYNSAASAMSLQKAKKNYPEAHLDTALLVYGFGDGGGGPCQQHLELLSREKNLAGLPKVKNSRAIDFFENLSTLEIKNHHKGELYLETHQGTLTTQAKTKFFNRYCETLLHNAEFLATKQFLLDGSYPHQFFEDIWKEILLYQFHDIIPGSSVTRVNVEARQGYQKIADTLTQFIDGKLIEQQNQQLCAFNASPFHRHEVAQHNGECFEVNAAPYSAPKLFLMRKNHKKPIVTENSIQNHLLKVTFNKNGEIVSCKSGERELCSGVLNRLTIYTDKPMVPFNAWDIDINYPKRKKIHLKADSTTTYIDGFDAICQNHYTYKDCQISQKVILPFNSDTVKFQTEVHWQTKHKMLRADFFPADFSDSAKFEIQFGHIERPTTDQNDTQRAQFEVCAHKWVAVESQNGGFALLNNCKYGHRTKQGVISLNLLRSPTFPDKVADRGDHTFTYAFCPFQNGELSKVIREGYLLNNPTKIYFGRPIDSFVSTNQKGVVVETVKVAEDNSGVILRLYESLGKPCNATLTLDDQLDAQTAQLCDMLENAIEPIDTKKVSFSAFEVKTIKIQPKIKQ